MRQITFVSISYTKKETEMWIVSLEISLLDRNYDGYD